jgi:hypothetical protein
MTPFKRGDLAIGTHYQCQAQFADAAHKSPRHRDGPNGPCMTLRGYGRICLVGDNMPYDNYHSYVSSPSQSDPPAVSF